MWPEYRRLPDGGHKLLRALCHYGAPAALVCIVYTIYSVAASPIEHDLHFLETFAGQREVTKAYMADGKAALAFEIRDHPVLCDFTGGHGFTNVLYSCLRLGPGAGFLSAPVCSTWARVLAAQTRGSGDSCACAGACAVPGCASVCQRARAL